MKTVVTLEACRSCYGLNQIGKTLTVKELIQELEDYPEDSPVVFSNDNGYTYGEISRYDLNAVDVEDEDKDEEN